MSCQATETEILARRQTVSTVHLEQATAALDAALRAKPDALVSALGPDGMTGFPAGVALHGQRIFDAGVGIDLFVSDDQIIVLNAWQRAAQEPVVRIEVHLIADPDHVCTIHFFDVRAQHDVHVVLLEADDPALAWESARARAGVRPGVARVVRDSVAVFTEVDEATTELLGWPAEELLGRRTTEIVHPEDTERAIEGWLALRSGVSTGRMRVRYRHADGHYVWVEVTNDSHLDDPDLGCVVSQLVDISAEMAHIEALREREQHLARLAEALPIGVCHLRAEGEVAYSNEPFVALLGDVNSRETLIGRVVAADRGRVEAALAQALRGHPGDLEVGLVRGADWRCCELTFRPLTGDDDAVDGVIVCAADVTDRSRLRRELEHRADHDDLSGCLNRAAAVSALEQALRGSPRVAVAYIDLNNFKRVNDDLGHAAGDELLRVAASLLRGVTRSHDRLGRMGGDEFVLICPQVGGPLEAAELVNRLSLVLNVDVAFAGQRIPLRASVGVAVSEPGEVDAEALLVRADAAMYEIKRQARQDAERCHAAATPVRAGHVA
jgi:diguanylate cyclase (GGDEF)-like protein/PAS domain S-box-containing protein